MTNKLAEIKKEVFAGEIDLVKSSRVDEIQQVFVPMFEKMDKIEVKYNKLIDDFNEKKKTDDGSNLTLLCTQAGALRKELVKVRTGTAKIHKATKKFYLLGGRFVDGIKNSQLFAGEAMEDSLDKIEKYYDNLKAEKEAKLQEERLELIAPFDIINVESLNLGEMQADVWDKFLSGAEFQYNARIEAEKEAEKERKQKEQQEALINSRRIKVAEYKPFVLKLPEITAETTEEDFEKIIKDLETSKKSITIVNERKAKVAEFKTYFNELPEINIGMSQGQFDELLGKLQAKSVLIDIYRRRKTTLDIYKSDFKLTIETSDKEFNKVIEELKAEKEKADNKKAKEKADEIRKESEEAERKAKEEKEAKEKADEDYQQWLKDNDFNSKKDKIIEVGGKKCIFRIRAVYK